MKRYIYVIRPVIGWLAGWLRLFTLSLHLLDRLAECQIPGNCGLAFFPG